MRITVLGCGNAFSARNYQQSFLVEEDGRRLVIDFGSYAPLALKNAGIPMTSIDDVYVSHAHADHIGGLEALAFTRYDWQTRPRKWKDFKNGKAPRLIGNVQLLRELWDESLRGGLKSMEGFVATLDTFFEVQGVEPNETLHWQGWDIDLVQQVHVMAGNSILHTYGLIFRREGRKTVYFTTDSQYCSPRQIQEYYRVADLIFQDCECLGVNLKYQDGARVYDSGNGEFLPWPVDDEMRALELCATPGRHEQRWKAYRFGSGVHANYMELAGAPSANNIVLDPEVRAKMWLSHYQDFVSDGKDGFGNNVDWDAQAVRDGFAGFVKVGQVFDV